jgi:peptidyl-dipeptidase Dcp
MNRRTFSPHRDGSTFLHHAANQLSHAESASTVTNEPMLAPFAGPHGGVPRSIRSRSPPSSRHLEGHGSATRRDRAIVANPEAPTFENTLAALQDSGRPFGRVTSIMHTYTSTMNDKAMQEVEKEMAPILAAYEDEIVQNTALFQRIKAVLGRTSECEARLGTGPAAGGRLPDVHVGRVQALDAKQKARLKEINGQLATLYTTFSQTSLPTRKTRLSCLKTNPISRDCRSRWWPQPGRLPLRKAKWKVGDHEYALFRGAVPRVFNPARPARKGVADVCAAR